MSDLDLKNMDTRVMEYYLRNRDITRAEYDAHMATLPDEAEEGRATDTEFASPVADRQAPSEPVAEA